MPSPGSRTSSKSCSSCGDLADARDLAVPEVVQEPADAPLEALLGGLVAERGRVPVGREVLLQVLAGGRRLPAGDALATLAGERLERGVGGRSEGERGGRLVRLRDPVDVAERVPERAGLVRGERRVAEAVAAAARPGAGWRRRRRRARGSGRSAGRGRRPAPRRRSSRRPGRRPRGARRRRRGRRRPRGRWRRWPPGARRARSARRRSARRRSRAVGSGMTRRAAARRGLETGIGVPSSVVARVVVRRRIGAAGHRIGRLVRHRRPVDDGELHAGPLEQLRHEPGRRLLRRRRRAWSGSAAPAPGSSRRTAADAPRPCGCRRRARPRAGARAGTSRRPARLTGHSPSSRFGTMTIGNSSPFAWYRVMSRTPSTSSDSSTLVGQLAAGGLVGVEVGDEVRERPGRVGGLPVRREAQEARDVDDGPLGLQRARPRSGPARRRSARGTARGSCTGPRGRSAG